jgi:hypothetical protein
MLNCNLRDMVGKEVMKNAFIAVSDRRYTSKVLQSVVKDKQPKLLLRNCLNY